jgi:LEA14-like dessication related protein
MPFSGGWKSGQPQLQAAQRLAARGHRAPSNCLGHRSRFHHPNAIGLRLEWLDFDLAINDTPILTSVRAEQGVHIPAHGLGDVHLRTRIGYQNLKALFRQIADMIEGNRATYAIHGNAYYKTPFGERRFPMTLYSR